MVGKSLWGTGSDTEQNSQGCIERGGCSFGTWSNSVIVVEL